MTISIAGQAIPLTVAFEQQDHVRDTERHVRSLYDKWRARFPAKSINELLAMMAYQYASFYMSQTKQLEEAELLLSQLDSRLDSCLSGTAPDVGEINPGDGVELF